jgi:hypothetical protein
MECTSSYCPINPACSSDDSFTLFSPNLSGTLTMADTYRPRLRTSILSTQSFRQRKISTDRHQSPALRSILNEESRTERQTSLNEKAVDDNHVQFSIPDFESQNFTTLSRAATGLSPLEVHPGQRIDVRGFMPFSPRSSSFAAPFPKSYDEIQHPVAAKSAVIQSQDIERVPGSAQTQSPQELAGLDFIKRFYRKLGRSIALTPKAAPSADDWLALRHVDSAHLPWHLQPSRQVLYVLEYDKGRKVYL